MVFGYRIKPKESVVMQLIKTISWWSVIFQSDTFAYILVLHKCSSKPLCHVHFHGGKLLSRRHVLRGLSAKQEHSVVDLKEHVIFKMYNQMKQSGVLYIYACWLTSRLHMHTHMWERERV